jgi:hypothetical protein
MNDMFLPYKHTRTAPRRMPCSVFRMIIVSLALLVILSSISFSRNVSLNVRAFWSDHGTTVVSTPPTRKQSEDPDSQSKVVKVISPSLKATNNDDLNAPKSTVLKAPPTLDVSTLDFIPESVRKSAANRDNTIPHHFIFIDPTRLLELKTPTHMYQNVMHTMDAYRTLWNEPDAPVWWLTDSDCELVIEKACPTLLSVFQQATLDTVRHDVCQAAALYLVGGYFFDVSIAVVKPVPLESDISFSSARSPSAYFFQAFVAIAPRHELLHHSMEVAISEVRRKGTLDEDTMCAKAMKYAYNDLVSKQRMGKHKLLEEVLIHDKKDMYPDLTRQSDTDYRCNFIIHDEQKKEVYFFSRMVGSTNCPAMVKYARQIAMEIELPINASHLVPDTSTLDFIPESIRRSSVNATYKIPHHFVFTDKTNLLELKIPTHMYQNVLSTIDAYRKAWNDPEAPVWFLTDDDCQKAIEIVYPIILPIFIHETMGMFKADICRVAALYLVGGYYFDIDIRVVQPVLLQADIAFSTAIIPLGAVSPFFQAFMAMQPRHPLMLKNMEDMIEFYKTIDPAEYMMGPKTLRTAYDILASKGEIGKDYFLEEMGLHMHPDKYPDLPRQSDTHPNCNYIVHDAQEQVVYFYSRIVGSSHCKAPVP